MEKELDNIKDRYKKRESNSKSSTFSDNVVIERNKHYYRVIKNNFKAIQDIKILEIGAGSGANINFFKEIGIKPENIYGNELLLDRVIELRNNHPDINIIEGDAREIKFTDFDVVFQSTVFTSILDLEFRKELANKMWSMLKPNGIILWYDFTYNNPKNKDVLKVSKSDTISLFPKDSFRYGKKITLAPPIGRRVGVFYSFFNLFPFLRTHYIAVFRKK